MVEHLFDHDGSAPVPSGYLVVETETDFLRQATSGAPLLIRGAFLCEWLNVSTPAATLPGAASSRQL